MTVQMPNLAQIETKGLYSVRKADYRTVLLIQDPKNPLARWNPDVIEDWMLVGGYKLWALII